jgi:hypothetical protein
LMALAEIAVEVGNDSGAPQTVSVDSLGDKFVELYWRQAAPYSTVEGVTGVLSQNRGTQAAVIRHVEAVHSLSRRWRRRLCPSRHVMRGRWRGVVTRIRPWSSPCGPA